MVDEKGVVTVEDDELRVRNVVGMSLCWANSVPSAPPELAGNSPSQSQRENLVIPLYTLRA